MTLDHFFNPRGVVVIGSTAPGKLGYELIRQLQAGGYAGALYAVNPKAQGVGDVPGFPAVTALDGPADLAVVVSPAATVAAVLEECGQAGIKAAVVITSGFGEVGNRAGEAELVRVAAQYGIRVIGPNCAGILNTGARLFATLEMRPPAGAAAFISQSGALGGAVLSWAEEQGVGISKFVSYGNRVDVDEIELLPYLADDPETKVVALYIESVARGPEFMAAVQAFTARKPLIVIKSGRSRAGQRATLSHTGSLAGADAVYDAVFKQCGALRVDSVEEMFDLCKGFVHLPPVRGRRVAIVTNSGGPGVLAADRAEALGLEVAEPSAALRADLGTALPPHAALRNPVDLTVEGTEAGFRTTLTALLDSGEYDAALALHVATPYLDSVALARGIADAAQATGKPVVANFMAGSLVAEGIAYLQARGIPNFATGERAMGVLARMAAWVKTAEPRGGEAEELSAALSSSSLPLTPLPAPPILEPEAMAWLQANGLPVPEFRWVQTADEAVTGCRALGYPVVMKVVSPQILHKSDVGGVLVGIKDDAAARAAFAQLERVAAGREFRGVVIYPRVKDAQEVILGLSRDPQFGPVVVVGLGGIYTELWRDVALRVAPVNCTEAAAMLRELKSYRLLTGFRGQPPRDLAALAETVAAFSQLPLRYPEIMEMDLNPVFLLEQGLMVGDVRIIVRPARTDLEGHASAPDGAKGP